MSTHPCACGNRSPVMLGEPPAVFCSNCGGLVPRVPIFVENQGDESAAKSDILRPDVAALRHELAMLRRQFNQRVDKLEQLISRHAD